MQCTYFFTISARIPRSAVQFTQACDPSFFNILFFLSQLKPGYRTLLYNDSQGGNGREKGASVVSPRVRASYIRQRFIALCTPERVRAAEEWRKACSACWKPHFRKARPVAFILPSSIIAACACVENQRRMLSLLLGKNGVKREKKTLLSHFSLELWCTQYTVAYTHTPILTLCFCQILFYFSNCFDNHL